jgi:hypothetical protein
MSGRNTGFPRTTLLSPPIEAFSREAIMNYEDKIDDSPPTYSESVSVPFQTPGLPLEDHPLEDHLRDLARQIAHVRTAESIQTSQADDFYLSLLTANLKSCFEQLAISGLQKGTLVLVPEGVVADDSELASRDTVRFGEFMDVRRVGSTKEKGYNKMGAGWWKDGDMAKRLAVCLQPQRAARAEPQTVQKSVDQGSGSKSSNSWWKRRADPAPEVVARRAEAPISKRGGIDMVVKAEEVTFRRQTPFGLWESQNGWGIIVTLSVD